MTRIVLLALAMATVLFSPSAQAQNRVFPPTEATKAAYCASRFGPNALQQVNAADSTAFARAWLPALAHLTNAIPALSPREERWLEEEEQAPSAERIYRAAVSRETSLQQARWNAEILESLMRIIVGERDNAVLIQRWLTVINALVTTDVPHHLTRLVAEKVIPRKALPEAWELLAKADDFNSLRERITWARAELVSNIVLCTLPSLGVGNTWPWSGLLEAGRTVP